MISDYLQIAIGRILRCYHSASARGCERIYESELQIDN